MAWCWRKSRISEEERPSWVSGIEGGREYEREVVIGEEAGGGGTWFGFLLGISFRSWVGGEGVKKDEYGREGGKVKVRGGRRG